jgi:hypothetical protein
MGTYSKGANGTFSGKVGSIVGSNWRNVNYLRSLPKKSKKAPSELQLAQQAKFALAAAQLSPIKDVLNLGFGDKKLNQLTGYNVAVKHFLTEAVIGDYPSYEVDYANLRLSKGNLHSVTPNMSQELDQLAFSWLSATNTFNAFADDKLVFVLYNETKKAYYINDAFERGQEQANIPVLGLEGDQLQVWVFCVKRDSLSVSNNHYIGSIIIN